MIGADLFVGGKWFWKMGWVGNFSRGFFLEIFFGVGVFFSRRFFLEIFFGVEGFFSRRFLQIFADWGSWGIWE